MKQNLLFNQASALGKRLAMVLTMLLTVGIGQAWAGEATLAFDETSKRTTYTTSQQVWTQNGITLINNKASSTSNVGDYSNPARFYKSSEIIVECSLGNITQIEFTCSSSSYATALGESISGSSTSESVVTVTLDGTSSTFTVSSLTAQVRISSLTVTYTAANADPRTVTFDAGSGTCDTQSQTESSAGEGVTLPEATITCGEWSFAGWAEAAIATETTTAPATLLNAGDNYIPTEDCTLYAVYKRTEEGEDSTSPAEVTKTYTFSDYTAGTQYADNEEHVLDEDVTIYTTDCHFTTQLRIYSSSTYDGYVISNQLPGRIVSMGFNAGNKVDNILVYGSTDGSTWTSVGSVAVTTTSYNDYIIDFGSNNYTYFKLDVEGSSQIRIAKMSITYESTSGGGSSSTTYYHSTPECSTETLVSVLPKIMNF